MVSNLRIIWKQTVVEGAAAEAAPAEASVASDAQQIAAREAEKAAAWRAALVGARNQKGLTALHVVCSGQTPPRPPSDTELALGETVAALLQGYSTGAGTAATTESVDAACRPNGRSAMWLAAAHGHVAAVQALASAGADLNYGCVSI